ncbi:alpha/beta fold hydrolase [Nocardia sp. NPDC101769]|uniref:alpha/beta fold hydrolase n=1 Tax=Nocardia sp. NPDC101769 TaxID=3364333 RepID=UPI0038303B7A
MNSSAVLPDRSQTAQAQRRARKRGPRRPIAAAVVGAMLVIGSAAVTTPQSAAATADSTLTVDGQDIHISQDGPAGDPALVLIHGLGASTHWFDRLTPLLPGYHVIRVDLLGHGGSAKPAGDDYSIPQQGHRVAGVLDQLGIRHALVVGHSTGGAVATSIAEQRPDLVTGLALIDAGPAMSDYTSESPASQLLTTPGVGDLLWQVRTDDLLRQALHSAFATDTYPIPQQFVDDLRGMTYHAVTATDAASTDYISQRTLPDRLTDLGKPLLVIFGDQDRRWRPDTATDEYRSVPGATVMTVPDAGHSPFVEDPSRTAEILLPFSRIHAS